MNRDQRTLLLWALLATPACGLVVGFEPRELCDDCAGSTADTTANGGGSANASSTPSGDDSTAGSSANATTADGGTASGSGGSGGNPESSSTSTTVGNNVTTSSGGSTSSTGDGRATTSSGGSGMGGETMSSSGGGSAGGTGGGGTGGGGTGGGGTGGDAGTGGDGGTGGAAMPTAGGSTTMGGDGGSGGSGGTPSLCDVDDSFDAIDSTGTHPAALMLGRNNSSRPWDFSWVANDDIYISARVSESDVALAPKLLDSGGVHSATVIATQGSNAFVAYGAFASGNARIVMSGLNPLAPDMVERVETPPLGGDSAPEVVALALRGSTSDALVAALDAEGSAVLALFSAGEHKTTQTLPGPIEDLTALDVGASFAIAYVQGGILQIALVPHDLSEVEPAQPISEAAPITPGLGSLAAVTLDDGAALVWIQEYGVYMTTLDSDGSANESPIQVAPGPSVLPKIDTWGDQLFISWVDAASDALYLQRFPDGVTNEENPLLVSGGVTDIRYGLAADPFSGKPRLALVYSTDRLRMTIVNCPG